jgi:ribose 5-phosphate isomerase B
MPSKILIASDHAGFELKQQVERILHDRGFDVEDLGPRTSDSVDYADYAHPLAERVASGEVEQGILMCGTGLGMSYAANRHPGVRAAVSWAPEIAALARQHNDANVLVLPARFVSTEQAEQIVDSFLSAKFEGGRHARRVEKIERKEA